MFGKVMSLRDELIVQYFTLATDASMDEINDVEKRLTAKENPMTLKIELAHRMVAELHSSAHADTAQKDFGTRFQKGELTQAKLPTKSLSVFTKATSTLETLVISGIAESNSDARRLINQKAVKINDVLIDSPKTVVELKSGDIIRAGRKAIKIK
jgi:tyrosyl-tRNA synthetase